MPLSAIKTLPKIAILSVTTAMNKWSQPNTIIPVMTYTTTITFAIMKFRAVPTMHACDAKEEVEQYTIKAVASKEEAMKLGESGYEPFDEIDGVRLYRKRCIGLA